MKTGLECKIKSGQFLIHLTQVDDLKLRNANDINSQINTAIIFSKDILDEHWTGNVRKMYHPERNFDFIKMNNTLVEKGYKNLVIFQHQENMQVKIKIKD